MKIQRIDTYDDPRFTKEALYQHGCYLVDDEPYEIVIVSKNEAVICGKDRSVYCGWSFETLAYYGKSGYSRSQV